MVCRAALSAIVVLWIVPWIGACAGDAPYVDPSVIAQSGEDRGSSTIVGQDARSALSSDARVQPPATAGAGLCAPCKASAECGGEQDLCIRYDDGTFCGVDCTTLGCHVEYRCRLVRSVDGDRARQCVHLGDTCSGSIIGGAPTPDQGAARDRSAPDAGEDDAGEAADQPP